MENSTPFTRRAVILLLLTVIFFTVLVIFLQDRESAWFSTWAPWRVKRDQVTLTLTPEWVADELADRLFASLAQDDGTIPLLDDRLFVKIREFVESEPVMLRLTQLSRRWPAGLAIGVEYRVPACVVEVKPVGGRVAVGLRSVSNTAAASEANVSPAFFLIATDRVVLEQPDATRADMLTRWFMRVTVVQQILCDGGVCVDSRVVAAMEFLRELGERAAAWKVSELEIVAESDGYGIFFRVGANRFRVGKVRDTGAGATLAREDMMREISRMETLVQRYGSLDSDRIPASEL